MRSDADRLLGHIDNALMGSAVRILREHRKLTQKELAQKLDVTVNYLSLLENGRRGISIPQLNRLADVLQLPASVITFLGTRWEDEHGELKQIAEHLKTLILTNFVTHEIARLAREADTMARGISLAEQAARQAENHAHKDRPRRALGRKR